MNAATRGAVGEPETGSKSTPGASPRKSLWAISVGHAATDFYETLIPPLLPFFAVLFDMTYSMSGLLLWTYLTTASLFQPVFGSFVEGSKIRGAIIAGLLLAALVWGVVGFVPSYPWLLVVSAVAGLGNGVFHPAASVYVRNRVPGNAPMAIWSTAGNIGVALAPLAVTFVIVNWGMSATPVLIVPGLVAGWVFLRIERKVDRKDGRQESAANKIGPVERTSMDVGSRASMLLGSREVVLLVAGAALRFWAFVALVTLLPLFVVDSGGSEAAASVRLTALLAVAAVSVLAGGFASDAVGRRRVMVASMSVAALTVVGGLAADGVISAVLITVGGALLMAPHSADIVRVQELMPGRAATAGGLIMGLGYWLASVGVLLTSFAADRFGILPALMLTVGCAPLLAAFTALRAAKEV